MLLVGGITVLADENLRQRVSDAIETFHIRDTSGNDVELQQLSQRMVNRAALDLNELIERGIVQLVSPPRRNPNAVALTGRYGVRVYEDAVDIALAVDKRLPLLLADEELREQAQRVAEVDARLRLLWLPDYVASPEFRRGWRPL